MKRMQVYAGASLVGVALCLAAGCAKKSNEPKPPTEAPKPVPVVEPPPGAVGAPASGMAAISAPPGNSQITDAQVRTFVTSHRVAGALEATNVAILSTNFISNQQVSSLLHSAPIGVADEEPMCVVILSGKFIFPGPPGSTPTFPIAVEVFDARTGNLMQVSGLPSPPQMGR